MKDETGRWFWINSDGKHYYIFNPYYKNAQSCLNTLNSINNTKFTLDKITYWFEN